MKKPANHALFHAIVSTGVASAGCADERSVAASVLDASLGDAQASQGDSAPFQQLADAGGHSDAGCREDAGFSCLSDGTCTCVGNVLSADCASPAQHQCDGSFDRPKCWCDSKAPNTPADCAQSWHFQCFSYSPFEGCRCDTTAPGSPSDCEPHQYLQCANLAPPVGCQCIVQIV